MAGRYAPLRSGTESSERCNLRALKRHLLVTLLAAVAAAFAALPASGKEGVEATLKTQIPSNASSGEQLRVAWTLAHLDEQGKRQPFGAGGVYVRLFSAAGGKPTIGLSERDGGQTGFFVATVLVPEGGIGGIQIGLHGWANGEPSDVFFPITNNPLPAVTDTTPAAAAPAGEPEPAPSASATSAPAAQAGDGRSAIWIAVLTLVLVLALSSLGVLVWRRRHATNRAHPKPL